MEIRYEKHWSGWLNRDMAIQNLRQLRQACDLYSLSGGAVLGFESFKMVDYWAPWIESGKCMVFSIDTIDNESWAAIGADNRWRIENHEKWYHYVVDELVPYIRHVAGMANGHDQGIMTFGASMGAMHAANFYYRRPDLFDSCFAISGLYDNKEFFGDYCDELVYANCPLSVLAEHARRPLLQGHLQQPEEPDRLRSGRVGGAAAGIHPLAGHGLLPEGHPHPV